MTLDLFNYSKSFLNPALKLLILLLFLGGTYYAYRAARRYQGEISKLMRALMLVGGVGFLANLFRYLGDVMTLSWKWGESVGFFVFGLVNLYAAWYAAGPLAKFVQQMLREDSHSGGDQ
jgi:hypothetical protein